VLTAQLNDAQNILICLGDIPELRGLDERFGHLTAGEIIREVAARLDTLVASTSVPGATRDEYGNRSSEECVARFAADEFAVMLSFAADVAAEQTVLHRVLPALQAPLDIGGRRHVLDFHIGVAQAPLDASVTQELLHAADIALSSARRSGRLSTLYTPAMGYEETHRQQLVFDLRAALNEGLLTMAYQPIVAADDGRLTAVEALARWTHPEFGPIPPDTFIPIAEESGLMPQLSAWALNTALAACARWQEHKPGVAVAVNLSATDLQNPPTAQLIADALGRYGLQPELLNIELTETTVMADFGAAISMLQDLSALGINLAIDDFGTGYSSLAYLRQMPMKALKIDRSFVTTMLSDQGDAAIVSMIIGLARTLGLRTIAEGVEDAPTADHLASLRCDRLQGYGIARPMSEDAFATWLPARRYDNGELPSSGF
jgi:predicted signal transduction protein with EAL and GGDEF domain